MRKHRVFLAVLTLVLLTVTFSGCVIIPIEKNFVYAPEKVSAVSIYNLSEFEGDLSEEIDSLEPYYVLDESQHEDFLLDLAEIEFTEHIIIVIAAIDPSFDYDAWTVKITLSDGSYRLLSCDGYGEDFDSNGECIGSDHFSCDDDVWHDFINKYLPEELIVTTATEKTVTE